MEAFQNESADLDFKIKPALMASLETIENL